MQLFDTVLDSLNSKHTKRQYQHHLKRIEILPESLVEEYETKKREGLIVESFGLTVPVGKWRLPYLFDQNRIDKSQDPWILTDCRYTKDVGLEIDTERHSS
jgi:hypothetical protein